MFTLPCTRWAPGTILTCPQHGSPVHSDLVRMKIILISLGFLALGQARRGGRGTCPDNNQPECADGSEPQRPPGGRRGPRTCDDGANPLCSNGSAPVKPGPCTDGSTPSCEGVAPICGDGSALDTSTFPPCGKDNKPVCAAGGDPLCADGSAPRRGGGGGRGGGGRGGGGRGGGGRGGK